MLIRTASHKRSPGAPLHLALAWLLLAAAASSAQAQSPVYRCPGPPVLYTDALSPKEAQDKGCRSIEGTPITVLQSPKPRANAGAAATPSSAGSEAAKVDPAQQRNRDSERRRVLETELREAEERLATAQRELQAGAERKGDERNYQRYLDRMSELKANVSRQENDIQALKREISKLP
ncbi:hypothetical protein HNP55_003949 [Paucibacter oligotrophus]|uniref:DUF4124 domain-containing protein n=1 Tax=Roseateles oligotrophus TaxID=1769250 RepID=A0A840LH99_9BURK|nr:hypothetical protein [Roseateles oligotrophus]MBB4845399.1 hypothetical protein [Roseateles oligotrophus]